MSTIARADESASRFLSASDWNILHDMKSEPIVLLFALAFLPASAQSPTQSADVTVDVATIRPHPADIHHNNFEFSGNRFILEDQSIFKLISYAYSLNARQIIDAPQWAQEQHYDLSGTTNLTKDATVPQQQQIIRQLLERRLGLHFHREKRELPVYALQIVKGQPKLKPAANPSDKPMEIDDGHGMQTERTFTNTTITDFVTRMQFFVDRPLVDQTGLTGRYDFQLTYTYGNAPSEEPNAAPLLFTAIQEQLGLKLQAKKAPIDVFVIEHIEQPTQN